MAGEGTRWVGLGGRRMVLEAQSVPASRNTNHLTYLFTSGRRKKAQPARVDQLVYLPHNATGSVHFSGLSWPYLAAHRLQYPDNRDCVSTVSLRAMQA